MGGHEFQVLGRTEQFRGRVITVVLSDRGAEPKR